MGDKDGKGDCATCNVAVAGAMALTICDEEIEFTDEDKKNEISCKTLRNDFQEGKITFGKLISEVKGRTTSKSILNELDDIVAVAKEHGINIDE